MHLVYAVDAAVAEIPTVFVPFMHGLMILLASSKVMSEARQAILGSDRIAQIAPVQCTGVVAMTDGTIMLSSIPRHMMSEQLTVHQDAVLINIQTSGLQLTSSYGH